MLRRLTFHEIGQPRPCFDELLREEAEQVGKLLE
jgi:hypothetical protein